MGTDAAVGSGVGTGATVSSGVDTGVAVGCGSSEHAVSSMAKSVTPTTSADINFGISCLLFILISLR